MLSNFRFFFVRNMNAPYKDKLIYALIGELANGSSCNGSGEEALFIYPMDLQPDGEECRIEMFAFFSESQTYNELIVSLYMDDQLISEESLPRNPNALDGHRAYDFATNLKMGPSKQTHIYYIEDSKTKVRSNQITLEYALYFEPGPIDS